MLINLFISYIKVTDEYIRNFELLYVIIVQVIYHNL